MAMHLGHFTVISLAENVTTLYSVLPVCQDGHNARLSKKHKCWSFATDGTAAHAHSPVEGMVSR